jgi:hypothetical protein
MLSIFLPHPLVHCPHALSVPLTPRPLFFTGVNQLQWALEFLKCMKVDYDYPKSINNVVTELEEQLIRLYAKIGDIMLEEEQRKEEERMERDLTSKTSQS